MTFSNEWDQRYQENTHMSIWPWSDLVSFVKRYSKSIKVSRFWNLDVVPELIFHFLNP